MVDNKRSFPVGADTNGIDSDIQCASNLCRCFRTQFAAIILSVRQEDDHLALCRCVLQTIDSHGERCSDRRSIFNNPDFYFFKHFKKEVVVKCQRRLSVSLRCKDDKSNAVRRAFTDKFSTYRSSRFKPIGSEVLGTHRCGRIQNHDDINPFCKSLLYDILILGSRHRQDREREARHS